MHTGSNLQSKVSIQTNNTRKCTYTTTVWLSENNTENSANEHSQTNTHSHSPVQCCFNSKECNSTDINAQPQNTLRLVYAMIFPYPLRVGKPPSRLAATSTLKKKPTLRLNMTAPYTKLQHDEFEDEGPNYWLIWTEFKKYNLQCPTLIKKHIHASSSEIMRQLAVHIDSLSARKLEGCSWLHEENPLKGSAMRSRASIMSGTIEALKRHTVPTKLSWDKIHCRAECYWHCDVECCRIAGKFKLQKISLTVNTV